MGALELVLTMILLRQSPTPPVTIVLLPPAAGEVRILRSHAEAQKGRCAPRAGATSPRRTQHRCFRQTETIERWTKITRVGARRILEYEVSYARRESTLDFEVLSRQRSPLAGHSYRIGRAGGRVTMTDRLGARLPADQEAGLREDHQALSALDDLPATQTRLVSKPGERVAALEASLRPVLQRLWFRGGAIDTRTIAVRLVDTVRRQGCVLARFSVQGSGADSPRATWQVTFEGSLLIDTKNGRLTSLEQRLAPVVLGGHVPGEAARGAARLTVEYQ